MLVCLVYLDALFFFLVQFTLHGFFVPLSVFNASYSVIRHSSSSPKAAVQR